MEAGGSELAPLGPNQNLVLRAQQRRHQDRREEQKQSHRKEWNLAAGHPASAWQPLYPQAGRVPSLLGRKAQKRGQTFQGHQKL